METLTIDKLAELGFKFIDANLMSNGEKIVDVYGKPFKMDNKPVTTVDDLALMTVIKPTKRGQKGE